ncbi:MAG: RBBP9/YdeN family alpha/beta hydrolase [Gammaproteobacteria bacterium]
MPHVQTPVLILPGYGDSGPEHWQRHWERDDPALRRVVQDDWLMPRLQDWIATLDRHVRECETPPVLAAHSLACSLVAHWATRNLEERHGFAGALRVSGGMGGPFEAPHLVSGALLVAPADVDSPIHTPDEVRDFSPIPLVSLPFPSIVVASTDDPFVTPARAAAFAKAWGSRLVMLPSAAHINGDAGYGPWPEGKQLLAQLRVR